MDGVELLAQAHAAGLRVKIKGDVLAITGTPHAAPLAKQLIKRKADIIPLLQAEGTGGLATGEAQSPVLSQAMMWLTTVLASGSRPESELTLEAKAEGISNASLRRAKTALGVESKRQGKHWVWVFRQDAHRQGAQPQGAQRVQGAQPRYAQGAHGQPANPKTITGADGRLYAVTLARCRRCSGTNWGPSGRHTPDGTEIWTCLDCLCPSPKTPPAPCARDRDEDVCPNCHDLYSLVKDTRSTTCLRCRQRF